MSQNGKVSASQEAFIEESQPAYARLISLIKQCQLRPGEQQIQQQLAGLLPMLQPVESHAEEQLVYHLLQIPPTQRNFEVTARIDEWLHDLNYFARLVELYGERSKQKLVAAMNCSYYRQGKQLIRVGEESDRFYVILRGEAVVLYVRDNKDVERQNAMIDREALRGMSKLQRIRMRNLQYFRGIPVELIENYDQFFNGLGVALYDAENILQEGQSFGELGIIFRQKRLAHILCRTDCMIATVPADQYMQLLAEKEENSILETMHFLEKYFFSGIGGLELKQAQRYLYLFSKLDKKMHSEICSVHQPMHGFYIILQGSVVLKRQESLMKSRPKSAGPLEFLKDTHKRKLQEYKMLLAGESFGLEEIVLSQDSELPCFAYTACTTSNSRLLFCPATKLLKLMKNDKQLTQDLLSRVEQRRLLRANQKGSCLRISETSPCEVSYKDRNEGQPFPPKYEVCKKSRSRNTIRSAEKLLYNLNRTTKQKPIGQQISLFNYVFEPRRNSSIRASPSVSLNPPQKIASMDSSRLLADSLLRRLQNRQNINDEALYSQTSKRKLKRTCRTAHPKFRH